jgi:decaprenylphospho-beta-D-ribofuranose 2-oxidase
MAASLADVPREVRTLESYSGLESVARVVFLPDTKEQLRAVFRYAADFGRRVTLHGGGHSFDAQALGDDLMVSLEGWRTIDPPRPDGTVRVGPGATWGEIVRALEPDGMVPPITVTTEHATAAGTLSGNCLSRFSPAHGKEGKHVVSFRLMTPDGREHECRRPPDGKPRSRWSATEKLFMAAIGGLGYIGAFLEITFKAIVDVPRPIRVRTVTETFADFDRLQRELLLEVDSMPPEPDPRNEALADAVYAAIPGSGEDERAVMFESSFTTGCGPPLILFQPDLVIRPVVEWLMRDRRCNELIWAVALGLLDLPTTYVNSLAGYTFFMDGNVKAKAWARAFGVGLKTLQQTFVVPVDRLAQWLRHARGVFSQLDVTPTLQDVLYLPQDLPFYLAATPNAPGFAVSYAFDTSDPREIGLVTQAFVELSDTLRRAPYRGRVYLVKNVRANPATIKAMYGADLDAFLAVKRRNDPKGILRNGFFERVFPGLA